uniref:Uncharacterized protein n=1 Tax=Nelumbo nucifera TaxID=4432 RepID=A0A822YQL5_NELNU|nr:TPA_asm: hypothetical protein HUJ06_007115 [Nelumbo nucifera]
MRGIVVHESFCYEKETQLTVRKTSLFFAGDGFFFYDYKDEVILMDASGKCLLIVGRKRPSLHQRCKGFLGERIEGDKPIFCGRRSSIIGRWSVFGNPGEEYIIDGFFPQRCGSGHLR